MSHSTPEPIGRRVSGPSTDSAKQSDAKGPVTVFDVLFVERHSTEVPRPIRLQGAPADDLHHVLTEALSDTGLELESMWMTGYPESYLIQYQGDEDKSWPDSDGNYLVDVVVEPGAQFGRVVAFFSDDGPGSPPLVLSPAGGRGGDYDLWPWVSILAADGRAALDALGYATTVGGVVVGGLRVTRRWRLRRLRRNAHAWVETQVITRRMLRVLERRATWDSRHLQAALSLDAVHCSRLLRAAGFARRSGKPHLWDQSSSRSPSEKA